MEQHDHDELDVNDLGLAADLEMLRRSPGERRRLLKMGAVGIGLLLAGGKAVLAQTAQPSANASTHLPLIAKANSTATPTLIAYAASVQNLSQVTLATDNVFSDGVTLQVPTVSGDVTNGYTVALTVGVAV